MWSSLKVLLLHFAKLNSFTYTLLHFHHHVQSVPSCQCGKHCIKIYDLFFIYILLNLFTFIQWRALIYFFFFLLKEKNNLVFMKVQREENKLQVYIIVECFISFLEKQYLNFPLYYLYNFVHLSIS